MTKYYFNPGCALCLYKPDFSRKIFDWLNENFAPVELHSLCCYHDPKIAKGSTIITVCTGCNRRFKKLYDGIETKSLYEILDDSKINLPNYNGAEMSIQDTCPAKGQPKIHEAVRNLLAKMNISLIEPEFSRERSICCGDSFYGNLSIEEVNARMKARAKSMPRNDVVVYCVSCIKSVYLGGKNPRYILDLIFGEDTQPQEFHTTEWHSQLENYIASH